MNEIKRVLILSVRAGAGHIRAAKAIEQNLNDLYPHVHTVHLDALAFTNSLFSSNYSSSYEHIAKSLPSIWGMIYNAFEDKTFEKNVKKASSLFNRLNITPLLKEVAAFNPDRIICTHFMPAEALAHRRLKGKLHAPLHVVITDYDVHTMWLQHGIDHYHVATREMEYALNMKTFGRAHAHVTGIPVLKEFSAEYPSSSEMRKKLGFADKHTVILSAGGFGLIPIDKIVEDLVLQIPDIQIIAVAGKNEKLEKKLRLAAEQLKGDIHTFGFVDNMHELMAASDLMIAKPGGLTTSESLAMGLPMIILKPIPGQEERNAVFLLEAGAGVWAHTPELIIYKTKEILKDGIRLQTMKNAARNFGKPFAAQEIVKRVMTPVE